MRTRPPSGRNAAPAKKNKKIERDAEENGRAADGASLHHSMWSSTPESLMMANSMAGHALNLS
jgi:hypothetical protein